MIDYIKTQKDLLNSDLNLHKITKEEYDSAMFELESAIDCLKKKDRRLTMGFECGFNKIKKFKDFTVEKIMNIENYLQFKKYVDELDNGEQQHSYEDY